MLSWYNYLPLKIDPVAFEIGSFSVRWYSISYIVGFLVIYLILRWRMNHEFEKAAQIFNSQFSISNKFSNSKSNSKIKNSNFNPPAGGQISNLILDFLIVAFVAAMFGGRLGYVIFYDFSYFVQYPLQIVSPFDQQGNFSGFYGMSFYGAAISVIAAAWFFCKKRKINFFAFADFIVPAIPVGYFFGRIGNFLNGELFGRITTSPLGIYFQNDPKNLRHPSQLYEAFLEGAFLFFVLWVIRNKKAFQGKLFFVYLAGYAATRFVAEFFREPDAGLRMFGIFTIGQILSMFLLTGVGIFYFRSRDLK